MYIFETTEQNNTKANDYETKALLHLLNFRKDSKSIETFAIDCFNDVTGCNKKYTTLWDVQSKNVQSLNPRKIGQSLVTLYSNFEHEFPFKHFIFLMPKLKEGYLKDENIKMFNFENFITEQKKKVRLGLSEEYKRRKNQLIDNEKLNTFLLKVIFVIGNDSKVDYVKGITNFKTSIIQDKFFEDIFNEIRDKQTALKNICIHCEQINTPVEVKNTKKIFKRTDFDTLIINRFIGYDLFKNLVQIPISFHSTIKDFDTETIKDTIQNANAEIAKILFDKNNKKFFWKIFEVLIETIKENSKDSSVEIYNKLLAKSISIPECLSKLTIIYLISLVKDGWQQEE